MTNVTITQKQGFFYIWLNGYLLPEIYACAERAKERVQQIKDTLAQ